VATGFWPSPVFISGDLPSCKHHGRPTAARRSGACPATRLPSRTPQRLRQQLKSSSWRCLAGDFRFASHLLEAGSLAHADMVVRCMGRSPLQQVECPTPGLKALQLAGMESPSRNFEHCKRPTRYWLQAITVKRSETFARKQGKGKGFWPQPASANDGSRQGLRQIGKGAGPCKLEDGSRP